MATECGAKARNMLHTHTALYMDSFVSIAVVSDEPVDVIRVASERALTWFGVVEAVCSRFDEQSEVCQLTRHVGEPCQVSTILFELTHFALALARLTAGTFDPTVGGTLERRGFNRNYRTGAVVESPIDPTTPVSYRDVQVNPDSATICLRRPLVLDLGAVAKGLAIDLAARTLAPFPNFCVDAGGDLYVKGNGPAGGPWRIGVRHPRESDRLVVTLPARDGAVCTSGDYERPSPNGVGHHLVDPRSGRSSCQLASVTVLAPTALAADGLATAAFILGPVRGRRLLEEQGVAGLLITPELALDATRGLAGLIE
jgi:thiamine biosynthesis lipoprotein